MNLSAGYLTDFRPRVLFSVTQSKIGFAALRNTPMDHSTDTEKHPQNQESTMQQIEARPSSGKTTALTQSKQQQIGWLAQQVAIAKAYFPAAELTQQVAEVYMIELAEVAAIVGPDKAETALRTACRGSKFFPSVSEIRDCAGLNPQKLLAVAQDRAWRLARQWGKKWRTGTRYSAGFRADVNETYEAECC